MQMYCPQCNSENSDSAKFCKKCGKPLQEKAINHKNLINEMNTESSGNDTTKIIIIALIVIAVVLAGAFIYIYGISGNNSSSEDTADSSVADTPDTQDTDEPVDASEPTQSTTASAPQTTSSSMDIIGGSFSTGSGLSDKTYASIYVGTDHAGENVKIQIFYSRDGSSLNNGNMVPKTVGSDGYIDVASAEAYSYYPDFATINLYDSSGNLLDTQSVNLSPESGTQYF